MEAPPTNYLPGGFVRNPGQGFEFGGAEKHLSDEDILIQYVAKNMDLCIGESITNFADKAGLYFTYDIAKLVSMVLKADSQKKIVSMQEDVFHAGRPPPPPFRRWPVIEDRGPEEKPGDYPYLFKNTDMVLVHLIWRRWVYIGPGNGALDPRNYKITDNWRESFNYPGNKPWTNYGDWTSILKFQFEFNGKVLEGLLKTPKVPHPNMDHNVLLKTITDQIKKQEQVGARANSKMLSLIYEKLGPLVKLVGSWNNIDEYVQGHGRNGEAGACGHRQGENLFGQLVLIMFFKYVKNYEKIALKSLENLISRMTALTSGEPSAADRELARKARSAVHQENHLSNAECPWIVLMAYFLGLDYQQEQILHELFVFYGGTTGQILTIFAIMSYISCKKENDKRIGEDPSHLPGCQHYAESNKGPVYLINIMKPTVRKLITEINRLVTTGIIPNNTVVCVLIDGHITTMLVSDSKLAFVELQGEHIRFIDFNENNKFSAYFYRVVGGWRGNRMYGPYDNRGYMDEIAVFQAICIPFFGDLNNLRSRTEAAPPPETDNQTFFPLFRPKTGIGNILYWCLSQSQADTLMDLGFVSFIYDITQNDPRSIVESIWQVPFKRDLKLSLMRQFNDEFPEWLADLTILKQSTFIYLSGLAFQKRLKHRDGEATSFEDMMNIWVIPYFNHLIQTRLGKSVKRTADGQAKVLDASHYHSFPPNQVDGLGLTVNFFNGYDPTSNADMMKWGYKSQGNLDTIPSLMLQDMGVGMAVQVTVNQIYATLRLPAIIYSFINMGRKFIDLFREYENMKGEMLRRDIFFDRPIEQIVRYSLKSYAKEMDSTISELSDEVYRDMVLKEILVSKGSKITDVEEKFYLVKNAEDYKDEDEVEEEGSPRKKRNKILNESDWPDGSLDGLSMISRNLLSKVEEELEPIRQRVWDENDEVILRIKDHMRRRKMRKKYGRTDSKRTDSKRIGSKRYKKSKRKKSKRKKSKRKKSKRKKKLKTKKKY